MDQEPQKRRGSIFDDLPKTVLKNSAEVFSDEPFRKQSCIENEDALSGTCESLEDDTLSDCVESESGADSESELKSVPKADMPEIETEPECASPEMAPQIVCTTSQLPAPIFLKEEQFSFSSSLKV